VRDIASVTEEVRDRAQLEKMTFSAFRDEAMRERIASLQRPFALIAGVETHVCVQQTAIDLINAHMQPVILADAVGSRRPADRDVALDRMRAAGAIVTTVEAAIFEMLDRAGTDLFKRMLPLVK
jgi:nicotinamidase-related amidase